jgi:hypothetical protein
MANKVCIYYKNQGCTNNFACAKKQRQCKVVSCRTNGILDWDKLKETEKRGTVMEKKIGRPLKNPDIKCRKVLIKVPVPVLEMITGNVTEFVNEAILEKLVRKQNIK